ncbi:hypothetical protein ABAZ39_04035 [Azospirillum argentinense]|uniref:DUF2946 domain-containing protein n=1 Tax=Azospirillum argentinense TaxID=2970906 RepID=A0A060DED0_9PROT|nr:hypothetical protein [Azospirillum argentinense]AIB11197.1 hypothetical protein ABAZ39_04035 [Azospirillum argentinense]EZQ09707.1 hypothetical protein ABAZ39_05460 [Azospirillum argentinense]
MARLVSLLALVVLAVGLLGGAAPMRMADLPAPHCESTAVQDAADCDIHHPTDSPAPGKTHAHGAAGCLCLSGACDLTGLPTRIGVPFGHRLATLLPGADAEPAATAHAPPLPPPRA